MVEPFTVRVPRSDLDDLVGRVRATRWPEPATTPGWEQGMPLAEAQRLAGYWADGYDWRRVEATLATYQQVKVQIQGLGVHAVHVRSPHPGATPLLLTHGWPGSFLEFLDVVGPLADPPDPADAFHVVCPSLPGYGFSDKPDEPGWDIHRIALAWVELMDALGYPRFGAAGGDWGTSISALLAVVAPERLVGIHLVPPLVGPDPARPPTPEEQRALDELAARRRDGSAYGAVHATRPQTIGYGLTDSPVGLLAWIGEKYHEWVDPAGPGVSDDRLLDTVTLYWLTRTAASSARLYRESIAEVSRWFSAGPPDEVTVPTGASVFPAEAPRPSRAWTLRRFPNLRHWGEPAAGGHFPALEVPELYVEELRASFRALRGMTSVTADP